MVTTMIAETRYRQPNAEENRNNELGGDYYKIFYSLGDLSNS